jgi:hypothetical protein
MAANDRHRPWYHKWLLRSLLLIGFGLAMLLCALLIRPTQEFDPDIPTGLDDDERFALIGLLALCAGIGTTLVCMVVWIVARTRTLVQARRASVGRHPDLPSSPA